MDWTRYTTDPALAAFVPLEVDGSHMLIRREYMEHVYLLGLRGPVPAAGEMVRGGRQAHPVIELPGRERVVVRTYRRGGMVRHLNRDRYVLGHRSFEELRAAERARLAGIRVPAVIAAAEQRRRFGYGATLATRWIPASKEAAAWLHQATPAERAAAFGEAGRQIARMHDAGIAHPDLNLRNLLVRGSERGPKGAGARSSTRTEGSECSQLNAERGTVPISDFRLPTSGGGEVGEGQNDHPLVYLLDFDRARLFPGPVPRPRRTRDLRRLARSARKLAAPVGADEWHAMRGGYGPAWPLPDLP